MTEFINEDYDEYDPDEPDDDWYDDEPYRDPDPEDHEIAKSYEEYYDHCEKVHGGGECDCRPSRVALARDALTRRARDLRWTARKIAGEMHTVRLGPVELTVRFRPPAHCSACSGRGWFYSKTGIDPMPMPEGYGGTSLCGCGSAITRLAESRRYVRKAMTEPPF